GGVVPADPAPGVVVEVDVGEGEQGGALLDGVRLAPQRGVAGDAAATAGAGDLVPGGVEDAHLPAAAAQGVEHRRGVRDQGVLDLDGRGLATAGVQHDHGALPGGGLVLTGHQLAGAGAGAPVDAADVVTAGVGAGDGADLADARCGGAAGALAEDAGGALGGRAHLPDHQQTEQAQAGGNGAAQMEQAQQVPDDERVGAELVTAPSADVQHVRHPHVQRQIAL